MQLQNQQKTPSNESASTQKTKAKAKANSKTSRHRYRKPSAFTDNCLIQQIRTLERELGRTPTQTEFDKSRKTASVTLISRRFGSWNNFVEAAGLKINKKYNIPKEEIIAEVQSLAQKLGRTPLAKEFCNSPHTSSMSAVTKNFGTWNALLKAAGLTLNKACAVSSKDLFQQFATLARELGRPPTSGEFNRVSNIANYTLICGRFGSWHSFAEKALAHAK